MVIFVKLYSFRKWFAKLAVELTLFALSLLIVFFVIHFQLRGFLFFLMVLGGIYHLICERDRALRARLTRDINRHRELTEHLTRNINRDGELEDE